MKKDSFTPCGLLPANFAEWPAAMQERYRRHALGAHSGPVAVRPRADRSASYLAIAVLVSRSL